MHIAWVKIVTIIFNRRVFRLHCNINDLGDRIIPDLCVSCRAAVGAEVAFFVHIRDFEGGMLRLLTKLTSSTVNSSKMKLLN